MKAWTSWVASVCILAASPASSKPLAEADVRSIDRAVEAALAESGTPAASIAVVKSGELAFAKAYGVRSIENRVYPDAGAAIVVLVNADFGQAQRRIADVIEDLLITGKSETITSAAGTALNRPFQSPPASPNDLKLAESLFRQLQAGDLDRSRLSADLSGYYDETVLTDYRRSLEPLGEPRSFTQLRRDKIGGLDASLYSISWDHQELIAVLRTNSTGEVESFVMFPP